MLLNSKTLSISICCEPNKVYEFVSNITNLPKWAKTFCRSARKTNEGWIIETPQGLLKIHLAGKNEFGILDHYVSPSPGVEVFVPMRVAPNGSGSEVIFTVFQQPGMSGESYIKDIALVEEDLKSLKSVIEFQ